MVTPSPLGQNSLPTPDDAAAAQAAISAPVNLENGTPEKRAAKAMMAYFLFEDTSFKVDLYDWLIRNTHHILLRANWGRPMDVLPSDIAPEFELSRMYSDLGRRILHMLSLRPVLCIDPPTLVAEVSNCFNRLVGEICWDLLNSMAYGEIAKIYHKLNPMFDKDVLTMERLVLLELNNSFASQGSKAVTEEWVIETANRLPKPQFGRSVLPAVEPKLEEEIKIEETPKADDLLAGARNYADLVGAANDIGGFHDWSEYY